MPTTSEIEAKLLAEQEDYENSADFIAWLAEVSGDRHVTEGAAILSQQSQQSQHTTEP